MVQSYTEKEVTKIFLDKIDNIVKEYNNSTELTSLEKCEGVAFSILVMLDGCSVGFPSVALHIEPHPTDKEFNISSGNKYFKEKMRFNINNLHEQYLK